jgi:chemosensory pili system protein ChpA (sensor histidine kinase/response regulator)
MGRAAQDAPISPTSQTPTCCCRRRFMSVVQEAGVGRGGCGLSIRLDTIATQAVLAEQPALAHSAREAAAAVSAHDAGADDSRPAQPGGLCRAACVAGTQPGCRQRPVDIEEDDLRDIFLEEAREVVQNGLAAVASAGGDPGQHWRAHHLRRAFHTLKGSSRMVGLSEFGEAAWAMEQLLNTWLADQKPATDDLRTLAGDAMQAFGRWVEDIATGADAHWKAAVFRTSDLSEALRTEGLLCPALAPLAAAAPDWSSSPRFLNPRQPSLFSNSRHRPRLTTGARGRTLLILTWVPPTLRSLAAPGDELAPDFWPPQRLPPQTLEARRPSEIDGIDCQPVGRVRAG